MLLRYSNLKLVGRNACYINNNICTIVYILLENC